MGHAMVAGGARASAPVTGIKAGDLAVGSSVYLMENGVATEYLVVNQGKPSGSSLYDDSCDGLWLLRKDIKENRQWHNSTSNIYGASTIHTYLNGTFFDLFGSIEQSSIKQVKIPYINGNGSTGSIAYGANGLSTKVFLLGGYETGFTVNYNGYLREDGAKLSYFDSGDSTSALNKRICYLNGKATIWWVRSAHGSDTRNVFYVETTGYCRSGNLPTNSYGIRPTLILPSTALFDEETLILKGVA